MHFTIVKHVIDALEYQTGLIDIHLCALRVRSRRIRTRFCGASLTGSLRTTAKLWTLCLNNRVITPVLEPLLVNATVVNLIFLDCFSVSIFGRRKYTISDCLVLFSSISVCSHS